MAIYDGETVRVKVTVLDVNSNPVTDTGVSSTGLSIFDPNGNYAVNNASLTWDPVNQYWYFDWQDALPGTWTTLAVFDGVNFEVYNYGTIRVKPLKIEPTGVPTPITNDPNDP